MNNPSARYFAFLDFRAKNEKKIRSKRKKLFRGASGMVYGEPYYFANKDFIYEAFSKKIVDNYRNTF